MKHGKKDTNYNTRQKAAYDEWLPRHNAWLAHQPKAEVVPTSVPASVPTTVVGSGKRKSMKGGNIFKDVFKEVYKGAKY